MLHARKNATYMRNFVFGVEDSLASTAGLLAGVVAAGIVGETVIVAGVILIFVEAFSMGIGSLLSDNAAREYVRGQESSYDSSAIGAMVMFASYLVAGFIPLAPYVWLSVRSAFPLSIALSLLTLFLLGAIGARLSGTRILRNAIRMLLIGGIAVMVGVIVGLFVQ